MESKLYIQQFNEVEQKIEGVEQKIWELEQKEEEQLTKGEKKLLKRLTEKLAKLEADKEYWKSEISKINATKNEEKRYGDFIFNIR